ncbi:xanthine dehydrogenase accessory protein XdhC [Acetobacter persici]|uniref:xanthine dehydrogenase accessory protein XdhC n=1 Tax=Acetobacter persici TaxID=1076596 RepID=UPI001BACE80E|nr:xanthine dehydrogenase accessory protein XdhC [Acetobacter persici]MBS0963892.1 xanthine dehydrogenase accessory protein XdhC [Acetobacter persici]
MKELSTRLSDWHRDAAPVACVQVVDARGSTPRESGAFMLIGEHWQAGTIGGGCLEWDCVHRARTLLDAGDAEWTHSFVLGPETGQCCGGRVDVRISRLDTALAMRLQQHLAGQEQAWPVLVLFGAGHVGRALARALSPLPLRLIWVDPRPEEFGVVPEGVEARMTGAWEQVLAEIPAGSGVLVLTPNHSLDALIVAAALERGDLSYVGLIGSRTKRRRFEAGFREIGLPEERIAALICPIGDRGVRDKRPEIIAALVAAELIERFLPHPQQVA